MLRLEEDLSRLGDSLPVDTGLLIVLSGPSIGMRFAVESDLITIGRSRDNDVWLQDITVSSRHAEIHRDGYQFAICDADSTNGTFLNQKRLISDTAAVVRDGGVVGAGQGV
jgi:pSer/pThr/pTyr-binding forkhead associated (FHA) protein